MVVAGLEQGSTPGQGSPVRRGRAWEPQALGQFAAGPRTKSQQGNFQRKVRVDGKGAGAGGVPEGQTDFQEG